MRNGDLRMSVAVNPTDPRPQGGGKVKRQRIAKSLLDLSGIINPSNESQTAPFRSAGDAVELLEGAVGFIKSLQETTAPSEDAAKRTEAMQGSLLHPPLSTSMTSFHSDKIGAAELTAGFQDCTEEVIRYLVEEEHLSETNPIVQGLRQHLAEKERLLNVENFLKYDDRNVFMTPHQQYCQPSAFLPREESNPSRDNNQICRNSEPSSYSRSVRFETAEQQPKLIQSAFNLFDFVPMSHPMRFPVLSDSNITSPLIGDTSYAQPAHISQDFSSLDLQQLAENNPEIASITEEILSLLDDDDDMSVFDEESDIGFDSDIEQ